MLLAALICMVSLVRPAHAASDEVIGTVPTLLSASGMTNALYEESSFGDALADAVLTLTDCSVVIVNGGDLIGNLQPGETTEAMLNECIVSGRTIATAYVTPYRLAQLLESALSHVVLNSDQKYAVPDTQHGAFPQIAGMKLTYDPSAQPGERLVRVSIDGKVLDLTDDSTRLTLAATRHMFDGGYDMPPITEYALSEHTLTDAMAACIRSGMEDYSRPGKRIHPIGMASNTLPVGYLVLMTGVIVLVFLLSRTVLSKRTTGKRPDCSDEHSAH